jgi:hypothetical protein
MIDADDTLPSAELEADARASPQETIDDQGTGAGGDPHLPASEADALSGDDADSPSPLTQLPPG